MLSFYFVFFLASSVCLVVDEVDLVVLSIVRDSIELCTCLLEKFAIEGDDASLQVCTLVVEFYNCRVIC